MAIRDAKEVHLLRLKATSSSSEQSGQETLSRDGLFLEILDSQDITSEPGLVHARHAFLEDASFQWDQATPFVSPDWQYAVRFFGESGKATALLDLNGCSVGSWEQQRAIRLSPKTASGWKLFISRYFPEETQKSAGVPAKSK